MNINIIIQKHDKYIIEKKNEYHPTQCNCL